MKNLIELSTENFDELIKDKIVVVDFFATWCGPCKMLAPVLIEYASENSDITVIKIDVDKFESMAMERNIMSVPTLILMKSDQELSRKNGYMTKDELKQWVDQNK